MERTIVIIGGNRGIGHACVERIIKHDLPFETFFGKDDKLTVVFTARKQEDCDKCVKALKPNPALFVNPVNLIGIACDVESEESVKDFVDKLKNEHKIKKIDVLLANAGICDPFLNTSKKIAEDTLGVNYFGIKRISQALLPMMNNPSRLSFTSSSTGVFGMKDAPKIQEMINDKLNNGTLTEKDIDNCIAEFMKHSQTKESLKAAGFGPQNDPYCFSKGCLNALAKAWDKQLIAQGISCNSVDPGYVATDMTGNCGTYTPKEGALNLLVPTLSKKFETIHGEYFSKQNVAQML